MWVVVMTYIDPLTGERTSAAWGPYSNLGRAERTRRRLLAEEQDKPQMYRSKVFVAPLNGPRS